MYFHERGRMESSFDANRYIWISSELWLRSDLIKLSTSVKHILTIIPEQGKNQSTSLGICDLMCLTKRVRLLAFVAVPCENAYIRREIRSNFVNVILPRG